MQALSATGLGLSEMALLLALGQPFGVWLATAAVFLLALWRWLDIRSRSNR